MDNSIIQQIDSDPMVIQQIDSDPIITRQIDSDPIITRQIEASYTLQRIQIELVIDNDLAQCQHHHH